MSSNKIIVSGATSALMSAVIDRIMANGDGNITGITTDMQKAHRSDIEWVKMDLSKTGNDYSFLKGAEMIIHAAALSNAYSKQQYLDVNFQSTVNLVENAKKYGVPKFVYISSILACNTCGDYGFSKFKAENYIRANFNDHLIIRPSQLFGYGKKSPIDALIEKIRSNKFILCPVGDPRGLYPLYFKDAARTIYRFLSGDHLSGKTLTVVGPQAFNYKELAGEIAATLNKKVLIIPVPKWVLTGVKNTIKLSGLKIGIFPDQIVRLYHPNKNIEPSKGNFLTLGKYIRKEYGENHR